MIEGCYGRWLGGGRANGDGGGKVTGGGAGAGMQRASDSHHDRSVSQWGWNGYCAFIYGYLSTVNVGL